MSDARFIALIQSFPVLADYVPDDDAYFGMSHFLAWVAAGTEPGSGKTMAIVFIRWLWNQDVPFDLRRAWGSWDSAQRAAWQAWARDPFFP